MEIGSTLREARESRGITLEAVEEKTKIRRKYLEALENESFDTLPGRVYVKGFLKNYAGFLGLNAAALISAYEGSFPQTEKEDQDFKGKMTKIESPDGRKGGRVARGLLAVALVAALIYLPSVLGSSGTAPLDTPDKKVEGQNRAVTGDRDGQDKNEVKPKGVNLTLNVTQNESWMHVVVDGKPVFTGTVPAGEKKEFKGSDKITLRIGNAGVVQVELNGSKIGVLGGHGQVVDKEFNAPKPQG